jgi:hypothetical protein
VLRSAHQPWLQHRLLNQLKEKGESAVTTQDESRQIHAWSGLRGQNKPWAKVIIGNAFKPHAPEVNTTDFWANFGSCSIFVCTFSLTATLR